MAPWVPLYTEHQLKSRRPVIATPAATDIAAPAAPAAPVDTTSQAPAAIAVAGAPTNVATAIAHELRALGVEYFFLMTGRDNTFWIALQAEGIRQVLTRTESAAVYMADAYARLRGRPAFVYGGYGPGAANVAGAMAEPFWSGSPVVALTSAMRRADRLRKEYQELDQPPMFAPVTKWGVEASVPTHVPRLVREAARQALAGAPGPVYLGMPSDLFEATIPDYQASAPLDRPLEMPLARPVASEADTEAVLRALTGAHRPIILAGNGIHQSDAYDALRRVAEALAVPVATSSAGKGSISERHELALGSVGRYSRNYANAALRDADVILAIGTQLGGLVTDSYRLISPNAQLIHVNVDPEVIGLNFPTTLGIVADARMFLEALADACDRLEVLPSAAASTYIANLAHERSEWRGRRATLAAQDGSDGRPMRPEAILAVIEELMAEDAILVADTGYAAAWAGALAEVKRAGRHFLRADGSLGWAYPASLGAQMAEPDKQVICITGDGGFGYHIGDIETALRFDLPVVVVILNNQTLAFEAHVQTLLYDTMVAEVDDFIDVDYAQVARAFGARGARVSTAAEFREAFAVALERRGPTIIDAIIDRDAIAPVTRYDRVRVREL